MLYPPHGSRPPLEATGLTSAEVAERRDRFGANQLPAPHQRHPALDLLRQVTHVFAVLLWVAAALAFVAGLGELGWAIIAVVIVNGCFAFAQEVRAERATQALRALLPHASHVLRDGRKIEIPVRELVPDDVLLLSEGDRVAADARLIEAAALAVDESLLTGESDPVLRDADGSAAAMVFAGSYVTSGTGVAVVTQIGASTRLGSIAHLTGTVVRRPSPLRAELDRVVRVIAAFAVGAGATFFAVSLALGMEPSDGFLFAIGVIVALVPEGLLPTLTLSMAMSAKRMASRRALVRNLTAVETLGETTVICTDKTGTITENQMTARTVAIGGMVLNVSGTGYQPPGTILIGERPVTPTELASLTPLLRVGALCGDAHLDRSGPLVRCVGDPTEGALLVLAGKGDLERVTEERRAPRVREFPFTSLRRRMSTVHVLGSGRFEVLTKGSPEAILEACATIGGKAIDADNLAQLERDIERLASEGSRVIALARRDVDVAPSDASEAERELDLLGLVGMEDPVRPAVPDSIARCLRAGIRIVMVTGDHPRTAATVAAKAGLGTAPVLIGDELPDDPDALATLLSGPVSIIARATPGQKLRIAHALQARGEVVAMTGDGVNDAPALRQADIGVAMGRSGTDVAREAADLILLDDSFAHIVEAVEEGRAAFDNIRRFLAYHLTDNVAELAPFLVWALSGGSIPLVLSVLQILALDIGTDLLPALALGAERPEPGTMERPPRPRTTRLLDRRILGRAFGFLGPTEAILSLSLLPIGAAVLYGWQPGASLPGEALALATLSTMVFASIVAMQMANAFACRTTHGSLLRTRIFSNRLLTGAVATEAVALLAFVYVPPLQRILGHADLGARGWLLVGVTPIVFLAAEEIRKGLVRRRGDPRTAPTRP